MNKVVRHYPASRLPEDLRGGIDPAKTVMVTIASESDVRPMTFEEIVALREPLFSSMDDINAAVRQLRSDSVDPHK